MKTAEEVLNSEIFIMDEHRGTLQYTKSQMIQCMNSFASQQSVKPLSEAQIREWLNKRREIFGDMDAEENLMPSCYRCNHYKRDHPLEYFRELVKTLHERMRKIYIVKVAIDYGIIQFKEWDGLFYFEKFNKQ